MNFVHKLIGHSVTEKDGVATVAISRPPVNALDHAMVTSIKKTFRELDIRRNIETILLRGQITPKENPIFCAGLDTDWGNRIKQRTPNSTENIHEIRAIFKMMTAIRTCRKHTIAIIEGAALGGGLVLALNCDHAIAADDISKLTLPDVSLIVLAPTIISQEIRRKISKLNIKFKTPTQGANLSVQQLEEWKIIDGVYSRDMGHEESIRTLMNSPNKKGKRHVKAPAEKEDEKSRILKVVQILTQDSQ